MKLDNVDLFMLAYLSLIGIAILSISQGGNQNGKANNKS